MSKATVYWSGYAASLVSYRNQYLEAVLLETYRDAILRLQARRGVLPSDQLIIFAPATVGSLVDLMPHLRRVFNAVYTHTAWRHGRIRRPQLMLRLSHHGIGWARLFSYIEQPLEKQRHLLASSAVLGIRARARIRARAFMQQVMEPCLTQLPVRKQTTTGASE